MGTTVWLSGAGVPLRTETDSETARKFSRREKWCQQEGLGCHGAFPDKQELKHLGLNNLILVLSLNSGRDGRTGGEEGGVAVSC